MIRHIVLFKLHDEAGKAVGEKLAKELSSLKESTDGLMKENEVAFDVAGKDNSYDLALNSLFANMDDLEKYATHPEHLKVLDSVKKSCSSTIKIDYEV